MSIDLGPLQFDDEVVLRQLRLDLKDDWFRDPLEFEDIFKSDQIKAVVIDNFGKNNGAYRPIKPDLFNVPKSNFTLRYALETGITDRALYHGLIAYLVPFYDRLLPWNVFNHRYSIDRTSDKYLFKNAIKSWQDFLGNVQISLKEDATLLSTDLTNYYENIDLTILRKTMTDLLPVINASAADKARIRTHLNVLFECLREWCFSEAGGLPQNRDASSFLANIYMYPIDKAMLDNGYKYFRYMDDIKIACQDVYQARKALKDLSLALRHVRLAVNSGKTKICASDDVKTLAECLDTESSEIQQIDAIWHTRAIRPITRSFPLLKKLAIRLLQNGEADKRAFRFCIKRLEMLAHCPEFNVPPAYFAEITPLAIEALTRSPAATDQLARYLRAVPVEVTDLDQIADILQDPQKSIYTWQCYCLWTLLIHKKYCNAALLGHALSLVREGPDDANRSGAVLYAGAIGGKDDRIVIAENFKNAKSFLGQRASLIAVQELHYRPHIENHIQGHLREDLKGIFRQLNRKGIYLTAPEITPITSFIDLGRDYD
ncbi:hypothetical protein GAY31_19190 [Azospirillum brasilense]|nr:hypothetical protein [Azospirillum brasilense]